MGRLIVLLADTKEVGRQIVLLAGTKEEDSR